MNAPSAAAPTEPTAWTPTDFVSRILAAMRPLIRIDGDIGKNIETPQIVEVLEPLMGRFTVCDAVLASGLVRQAEGCKDGAENTALSTVWFELRDFICSAEGTSPACASARADFIQRERAGLSPECRTTVLEALRMDVVDFASNRWDGSLFGGRDADPDGPFVEKPWWEHRAALLKLDKS